MDKSEEEEWKKTYLKKYKEIRSINNLSYIKKRMKNKIKLEIRIRIIMNK